MLNQKSEIRNPKPQTPNLTPMNAPKQNKEALGKGIRSLLQSIDADLKTSSGHLKNTVVDSVTGVNRISIEEIKANPKHPRHDFDEQSMNELASSIKRHD